ncbi:DNA-binding XRE family transcriptional regulator [Bradyrhizobium sp. AZCC 1610]|uniref:helix-turn-helix transcriptional regulator n=1 Tax=Bradyrhizobium sp. AZCC 1610 TaxID=3117020 RepID=UPI002FF21824
MPFRKRKASDKYLAGEDVRAWRISRNLTQAELGKWLGLTPQAAARYEVVGVTKGIALAFAAIDRGLKPVKITRADYKAVEDHMKNKREEVNEEGSDA